MIAECSSVMVFCFRILAQSVTGDKVPPKASAHVSLPHAAVDPTFTQRLT